jgi:hypothetical protein
MIVFLRFERLGALDVEAPVPVAPVSFQLAPDASWHPAPCF